ncbi:hypothetical protein [Streptomyces sp. NPDC015350]|uniref:hypothetical protein n=1 Tax=Streptomyces sp. NPDC015350 TaxID=3364955 RepID=UPI0036FC48D3
MTRWIEDPSLDAPDGHRWVRAAPDDCPHCPCHTARTCEALAWRRASRPTSPDGTPCTEPCPCETREEDRELTVTVQVADTEHVVAARYRLGALFTDRIWEGVPHDGRKAVGPVRLVMALVPRDLGGPGSITVDSLGREWIQDPYSSHGGVKYRITHRHPE